VVRTFLELISLFREYFSDEWPTRRVAYLRIVYTTTEFVGKFFPVRKKSAVVENICCTNFFTEKNFAIESEISSGRERVLVGKIQNRSGHELAKCLYHEAQSYRKVETLN